MISTTAREEIKLWIMVEPGCLANSLLAISEVNSRVTDSASVIASIKAKYINQPGFEIDELDGLTVSTNSWWFNVRASNTEPLLRLNVEADTAANMAAHRDELLALINA